jgi:ribosomal protein L37AE/L43A
VVRMYPECPECQHTGVGRLSAPGWYYCPDCFVEFKYSAEGLIVYQLTENGERRRMHRRPRHLVRKQA